MPNCEAAAAEYKAGLPTNCKGVQWTMMTFSIYVHLLYPHITVDEGQEWRGAKAKYRFTCSIHGPQAPARAFYFLSQASGCQCKGCRSDKLAASAGTLRSPRASKEEKELATKLRAKGLSYREIGRQLGRSLSTIQHWLDPEQLERCRQRSTKWNSENRERKRANGRRYISEFVHGKANHKANNHKYRGSKYHASGAIYNGPDLDLIDPPHVEPDEIESKWFDEYDMWKEYVKGDPDAMAELSFEDADEDVKKRTAQQKLLEKISGEKYSLEHLIPLSKGGIHHPLNFANRALALNLQKNNNMLDSDVRLFMSRLFN